MLFSESRQGTSLFLSRAHQLHISHNMKGPINRQFASNCITYAFQWASSEHLSFSSDHFIKYFFSLSFNSPRACFSFSSIWSQIGGVKMFWIGLCLHWILNLKSKVKRKVKTKLKVMLEVKVKTMSKIKYKKR